MCDEEPAVAPSAQELLARPVRGEAPRDDVVDRGHAVCDVQLTDAAHERVDVCVAVAC